jgi:hypothetical protein
VFARVQTHQLAVAGINSEHISWEFTNFIFVIVLTVSKHVLKFIQTLSEAEISCYRDFVQTAPKGCAANRELTPTTGAGGAALACQHETRRTRCS